MRLEPPRAPLESALDSDLPGPRADLAARRHLDWAEDRLAIGAAPAVEVAAEASRPDDGALISALPLAETAVDAHAGSNRRRRLRPLGPDSGEMPHAGTGGESSGAPLCAELAACTDSEPPLPTEPPAVSAWCCVSS